MAARYQKQKGDVLAGVIGLRAPDGSIISNTKFYKPAEDAPAKAGQLTAEEKEVCEGIVSTMTDLFGQYIEGVKKLERKKEVNRCLKKSKSGTRDG